MRDRSSVACEHPGMAMYDPGCESFAVFPLTFLVVTANPYVPAVIVGWVMTSIVDGQAKLASDQPSERERPLLGLHVQPQAGVRDQEEQVVGPCP